jgi:protein tyrosine/serine phosphatase
VRTFLVFFLAALSLAAADISPPIHVRNFDKVNEHLFRGGAPTEVGLEELGALGVKTIIDLRPAPEGTEDEKNWAEKLRIKYINIPLSEFGAPTNAQMQQLLSLLEGNSETIFVHCRRGKDRTGTVIACYRIQHDGWDNRRALNEAKQHGMSSFERGMHNYILHFTPLNLPLSPNAAIVR